MEPKGIVKAFPKRKKMRDDSERKVPPKVLKEEGTGIIEGKSCTHASLFKSCHRLSDLCPRLSAGDVG